MRRGGGHGKPVGMAAAGVRILYHGINESTWYFTTSLDEAVGLAYRNDSVTKCVIRLSSVQGNRTANRNGG